MLVITRLPNPKQNIARAADGTSGMADCSCTANVTCTLAHNYFNYTINFNITLIYSIMPNSKAARNTSNDCT